MKSHKVANQAGLHIWNEALSYGCLTLAATTLVLFEEFGHLQ